MNHSNKNRNCAVGNSNNSSEESFFNDCATCCYEFRQSPPFPNKCIYDDVLQQYKMRLKKAELELTDRELQVAMMKDQRLKMETYCRNNMEETENLKARYVAVLDELENLKKHYEIVNDQKTKQKRASNEAFEALFKAELDKWNEENKKTLNKIELMDFDIQKLIQLLAEKTKAEEGNEMKQHIERIENLVAHQSTILNKLTAKVGENTVALNSSNQGIVDKMKALMEKTESDLLEQIESVQKKTQIISDDSSKLARLHSIENQIIDPDSSNTLQHLPPRNSVDEESIEQKFMQPSEMASPSLKLDAKDDVRISIQIQHVPSLRDVQNSNRKSTDESLPKTGKNSSSEQIKISPVEKWKDYTSQGIQTENNDEMKDLEDIEDKELMLLDEYYKDLCSEAIREPRGFHKPLFTDPEETITVSNCVDLISDNPRVIELTIEKEKRPNEKKKNEETKDTNMKNPREDIRKDVCRTVTTQTEDEIPLNQEECFAARESASSVENVSSELEQTSLLSGFREEDMPDCRKISKSSSDLVKCMVLGFPDNEVFKFADPPCRQQDIVSDFEVLFSKNENQQVEPDSSSGSTLPECCGDFSSTEDAVQKNIGSNMKGPAYFKMSESSSCKGEHDSSEQCCKQHLMKNDYFIPYSEDLDQHLKIEETRVACPFQVEKETQTLPEDYEHSEVDEDEEKNESIIEEKQPRVHLEEEKNTLPGDEIELNSSKLGESQTGSEKQDYQENKIVLPDLYQSIEREIEEEILRELSGSYSDLRIFEEVSMKDVLESPESEEIEVKQITELDSSPTGSFSRRDRKHERVSLDSLYKIKNELSNIKTFVENYLHEKLDEFSHKLDELIRKEQSTLEKISEFENIEETINNINKKVNHIEFHMKEIPIMTKTKEDLQMETILSKLEIMNKKIDEEAELLNKLSSRMEIYEKYKCRCSDDKNQEKKKISCQTIRSCTCNVKRNTLCTQKIKFKECDKNCERNKSDNVETYTLQKSLLCSDNLFIQSICRSLVNRILFMVEKKIQPNIRTVTFNHSQEYYQISCKGGFELIPNLLTQMVIPSFSIIATRERTIVAGLSFRLNQEKKKSNSIISGTICRISK